MKIYFENDANFITSSDDNSNVHIRCNFDYTDCGQGENLDDFVARHGGVASCTHYLKQAYNDATSCNGKWSAATALKLKP